LNGKIKGTKIICNTDEIIINEDDKIFKVLELLTIPSAKMVLFLMPHMSLMFFIFLVSTLVISFYQNNFWWLIGTFVSLGGAIVFYPKSKMPTELRD
jgi:hypothetical protein